MAALAAVTLLDLTPIRELRGITIADGIVRLGALTTHNDVAGHPELPVVALPLAQACLEIGSPQLRNRATIAGNMPPQARPTTRFRRCLRSTRMVVIASNGAERTVRLDDFFTGFRSTVLQPGELITAIEFPTLGDSESDLGQARQPRRPGHLGRSSRDRRRPRRRRRRA